MKLFFKKVSTLTLPLTLVGASQREARETGALPRLSRPVAPRPLSHGCRRASISAAASVGRWATSHRDVAAPKGEPSLASPFGGRWCPVGTVQRLVSAAASVGDGRSPLGCITRAGRRECPRRGRRGPTKSCPRAEDRKSDKLSKNPGNMRAPQFVP